MIKSSSHQQAPPPQENSFKRLQSTLNAIPDLMFELDEDGRHWDFRVLRPELLVAPPDKLMWHTVSEVMPPDAAHSVMAALSETLRTGYTHGTQIHLPTPTGDRWFEVSMARKDEHEGDGQRVIALSRDITDRKIQHIQAERLAYTDGLTELPNRNALSERLKSEISSRNTPGQFSALLFLDLDNFKALNDQRGHCTGDLLLKIVARRLLASVRESDLVIRWGGDEFVILISPLSTSRNEAETKATLICDQISKKVNEPYELNDYLHTCKISIGMTIFEHVNEDIDKIIHHADSAMYSVKRSPDLQYAIHAS